MNTTKDFFTKRLHHPTAAWWAGIGLLSASAGIAAEAQPPPPQPVKPITVRVVGSNVRNSAGQYLGRIEDLVLDPESGQVQFAMLLPDYPRSSSRIVPIPWPLLSHVQDQGLSRGHPGALQVFALNADPNFLRRAPSVDRANWNVLSDENFAVKVYRFYGLLAETAPQPAYYGGGPEGPEADGYYYPAEPDYAMVSSSSSWSATFIQGRGHRDRGRFGHRLGGGWDGQGRFRQSPPAAGQGQNMAGAGEGGLFAGAQELFPGATPEQLYPGMREAYQNGPLVPPGEPWNNSSPPRWWYPGMRGPTLPIRPVVPGQPWSPIKPSWHGTVPAPTGPWAPYRPGTTPPNARGPWGVYRPGTMPGADGAWAPFRPGTTPPNVDGAWGAFRPGMAPNVDGAWGAFRPNWDVPPGDGPFAPFAGQGPFAPFVGGGGGPGPQHGFGGGHRHGFGGFAPMAPMAPFAPMAPMAPPPAPPMGKH